MPINSTGLFSSLKVLKNLLSHHLLSDPFLLSDYYFVLELGLQICVTQNCSSLGFWKILKICHRGVIFYMFEYIMWSSDFNFLLHHRPTWSSFILFLHRKSGFQHFPTTFYPSNLHLYGDLMRTLTLRQTQKAQERLRSFNCTSDC